MENIVGTDMNSFLMGHVKLLIQYFAIIKNAITFYAPMITLPDFGSLELLIFVNI